LDIFCVSIPEKADIVIFDSFGNDFDFWQANKGLNPASLCLKRNGVAIMIAECPKGICHNIPEIEQYGFKNKQVISELHERKIISPIVSEFLLSLHRIVIENGRLIVVSRGITPETAGHVGLIHAETPKDALSKAFALTGPGARITVLEHAGNMCPVIRPDI
jgi:nickel-dependent lactate racemase